MTDLKASKEMLIDDLQKDPSVENIAKALCYLLRTSVTEEQATELHGRLCSTCPAKLLQENRRDSGTSLWARLTSPLFLLFVITILSLLTAMYATIGQEGFTTVTRQAEHTLQPFHQSARPDSSK